MKKATADNMTDADVVRKIAEYMGWTYRNAPPYEYQWKAPTGFGEHNPPPYLNRRTARASPDCVVLGGLRTRKRCAGPLA